MHSAVSKKNTMTNSWKNGVTGWRDRNLKSDMNQQHCENMAVDSAWVTRVMGFSAFCDCVDTQVTARYSIKNVYLCVLHVCRHVQMACTCVFVCVCACVCACALIHYINSMHLCARVNAYAQVREHVSLCLCASFSVCESMQRTSVSTYNLCHISCSFWGRKILLFFFFFPLSY